MKLLIVSSTAGDRLAAMGDVGATVLSVAQEVEEADIVVTEDGRLLKNESPAGPVEVRVV